MSKMMSSNYYRMSGLAAILGGVLMAVGFLIHPLGETAEYVETPMWVPAHAILFIAFGFVLLGIYGIQLRQADKAGLVGSIGFVVLFLGIVFVEGIVFSAATVEPSIAIQMEMYEAIGMMLLPFIIIIILMIGAGGLLFGVSIYRAAVLPKGAGALTAVGSVILLVASLASLPDLIANASGVLVGLSVLWAGFALWKTK